MLIPFLNLFCSNQITDEVELHRIVFDYLKQQKNYQNLVKCSETNEPISELVEEIAINQPTLFNNAKFEDIKFLVYMVNSHEVEVETIEVILNNLNEINSHTYARENFIDRMGMEI